MEKAGTIKCHRKKLEPEETQNLNPKGPNFWSLVPSRDVLTKALRQKKGRSNELIRALRYERALVYEDLGQQKRCRNELEKLYAEAPDYEDVAVKLGLG